MLKYQNSCATEKYSPRKEIWKAGSNTLVPENHCSSVYHLEESIRFSSNKTPPTAFSPLMTCPDTAQSLSHKKSFSVCDSSVRHPSSRWNGQVDWNSIDAHDFKFATTPFVYKIQLADHTTITHLEPRRHGASSEQADPTGGRLCSHSRPVWCALPRPFVVTSTDSRMNDSFHDPASSVSTSNRLVHTSRIGWRAFNYYS